ncbi:ABC transporter ATP-binding protein [Fervidibacillus albus]|uniref:ABC transporter ATP-binding protein n=1 Tax=Fervidibacillus albus TaxID=2980026 RepID=A0A9E8RXQ9_9BACI|nr:ABC transporter ATP-binding protein [Fervidibacillus albus]WAA09827.1 ABC transporter ATP-binding protein [Fervidibacillus albus]
MKSFIEVKNVEKSYDQKKVLNNISMTINEPGVYLLAGPNGCGKTTLLESIIGLRQVDRGEILVRGSSNHKHLHKHVGFLLQGTGLRKNLTVKDEMQLIKDLFQMKMDDQSYLKFFHLEQYYLTKTEKLSGGTKRRIMLALLFMPNYEVLILDEPASGLDTESRSAIWNFIKTYSKQKVIFVSDHYLNEAAKYCDYIFLMNKGEIISQGTKEEVLRQMNKTHVLNIQSNALPDLSRKLSLIDEKIVSLEFEGSTYVFLKLEENQTLQHVWEILGDTSAVVEFHAVDFEDVYFYLTGNLTIYNKGERL